MNKTLEPEYEPGQDIVRLNKNPFVIFGGMALLFMGGIAYATAERSAAPEAEQAAGYDPLPETAEVDVASLIGMPPLDRLAAAALLSSGETLDDEPEAAFPIVPARDDTGATSSVEAAPLPYDDEIATLRAALKELQDAQTTAPPPPPARAPVVMGAPPPLQHPAIPTPAEITAAEAEARRQAAIEAERQAQQAALQARMDRFDRARTASSRVAFGTAQERRTVASAPVASSIQPDLSTLLAAAPAALQAQVATAQTDAQVARTDANAAGELFQALLNGGTSQPQVRGINGAAGFPVTATPFNAVRRSTDPQTLERPSSPNLLRSGALIPAIMISGIRSDLPGPVIAQVSTDVYDTATGRRLLIPQGAKLIGRYDADIHFGQKRVFLAWTRIVFPDASALDLTDAQGIDAAGYAGFEDRANNHYLRTFGSAILLSAIGAGAQLSQPAAAAGETFSPFQIGAAELGRSLAETGREALRRNLDVAPTLTIRPGYRFNVFVQRDIQFDKPWR